jgi:hypothetical protein
MSILRRLRSAWQSFLHDGHVYVIVGIGLGGEVKQCVVCSDRAMAFELLLLFRSQYGGDLAYLASRHIDDFDNNSEVTR